MAGDRDERVGSDELVNSLTSPSQKKTYQDYWNAAYRGLVPGGLNRKGDSSAPVLPDGGDDAEPFSETPVTVVEPEEVQRPDAVPVVIFDDLSRVAGSTEDYFHTYQITVGSISPVMIAAHDSRRTRIRIYNVGNVGDTDPIPPVFIGANESVDAFSGFEVIGRDPLQISPEAYLEMKTTREVWAISRPIPPDLPSLTDTTVHVLVEYEKEI
jgi:hypothetical protein